VGFLVKNGNLGVLGENFLKKVGFGKAKSRNFLLAFLAGLHIIASTKYIVEAFWGQNSGNLSNVCL
jgi:hypothetical protein